jgi:hypothetical protein
VVNHLERVSGVDKGAAIICERTPNSRSELLSVGGVNIPDFSQSAKYSLRKVEDVVLNLGVGQAIRGHVSIGIVGKSARTTDP